MIHSKAEVYSSEIGIGTKIWQFAVILEGAMIGDHCNINCHTLIESNVKIGHRVTIKPGVFIWDGISIEDDVMIGPNVTFTNDKWPKSKNINFQLLETLIKKGASVGANATILCGIQIGEFALIGAGAVVTRDVPDRALVVGNPARIIGWMDDNGKKMEFNNDIFIDTNNNTWKVIDNKIVKI